LIYFKKLPELPTKLHDQKEFYQRIPEDSIAYHEHEVHSFITLILSIYGKGFQVIKGFFQDKGNPQRCWSQIKLDDEHFKASQKAGWVLHPCISKACTFRQTVTYKRYAGWGTSIIFGTFC
jgi:hypothetical protein